MPQRKIKLSIFHGIKDKCWLVEKSFCFVTFVFIMSESHMVVQGLEISWHLKMYPNIQCLFMKKHTCSREKVGNLDWIGYSEFIMMLLTLLLDNSLFFTFRIGYRQCQIMIKTSDNGTKANMWQYSPIPKF